MLLKSNIKIGDKMSVEEHAKLITDGVEKYNDDLFQKISFIRKYHEKENFLSGLLSGITEGTPCKDIITHIMEMGLENKATDYSVLAKLDKSLKFCIEGCQSKSKNAGLCLRIHNLGTRAVYSSMNEILRTGNPEAPKKLADIYFSGINGRYC